MAVAGEIPNTDDSILMVHPAMKLVEVDQVSIQFRGMNRDLTISDPGGIFIKIIKGLNSSVTIKETCKAIEPNISDTEFLAIREKLDRLIQLGYLIHYSTHKKQDQFFSQIDFLRSSSPLPAPEIEGVDTRLVEMVGQGVVRNAIDQALRNAGFNLAAFINDRSDEGRRPFLCVACDDHDVRGFFEDINSTNINRGIPTLYCTVDGTIVRVGPFVVPHQTACFHCFHQRGRVNAKFLKEYDAASKSIVVASTEPSSAATSVLAGLVASQAIKFAGGMTEYCAIEDVVELDMLTLVLEKSKILKAPRCPVCSRYEQRIMPGSIRDNRSLVQ